MAPRTQGLFLSKGSSISNDLRALSKANENNCGGLVGCALSRQKPSDNNELDINGGAGHSGGLVAKGSLVSDESSSGH